LVLRSGFKAGVYTPTVTRFPFMMRLSRFRAPLQRDDDAPEKLFASALSIVLHRTWTVRAR
jgi:hypothetical protein